MKKSLIFTSVIFYAFIFTGFAGSESLDGNLRAEESSDIHSLGELSVPETDIEDEATPTEKSDIHSLSDISENLTEIEKEDELDDQDDVNTLQNGQ